MYVNTSTSCSCQCRATAFGQKKGREEGSPAEAGERGGCIPAAGLLWLLPSRGLTRGLARGVLKLDWRSCSARLARSSASAILCTAPCATVQYTDGQASHDSLLSLPM